MEPDEAVVAPEVDDSAPAAEEVFEEASYAVEPTSMESALAEARAELASDESVPVQGEDAQASLNPPTAVDSEATPQESTESVPDRKATPQGVLDRILSLIQEGREAELDPSSRGVLRKLEERSEARRQEDANYRKLYLGYESEKFEDPDSFVEKMIAEPAIGQFMSAYKRQHPEISLENPTAQHREPSAAEVRAQVDVEYADAVTQTVSAIARTAGIDDGTVARLQAESGGRLGEFMARSFDEAVKVQAEKMRPEIARKEREAAELEAQARYANKTIITPRAVGGLPVTGGHRDLSEPFSMRDAMREARAEEAAGVS